jgi:hypothetical protein
MAFGHQPEIKESYDMKYVKIVGLCLVAALALSAVAAATASAKTYGFYKDNGKEEAAIGATYTGKLLSAKAKLETTSNGTIECSGGTGSGKVISLDDAEGTITFTGCKFGSFGCNSSGAKSEEIKTEEITVLAVLERLSPETKEPALLFKPLKETKLECTSLQKLTITNTTGTLGGLLVLIPAAASTFPGWLGTNNEGRLFHMAFEQKEGLQKGAEKGTGEGEFLESEAGEIMKSGLTTTGSGLKTFKELSAEEAELSIETSEKISIFA